MSTATHIAWRFLPGKGGPRFVHTINRGKTGDRYSYTIDGAEAKKLTEAQCRAFCSYMRKCASVGYWG